MLKTLQTMTLAVTLTAAVAVGAHAQTIDGYDKTGKKIYTALVTPTVSKLTQASQTYYMYDYLVTLQATTPKVNVNSFDFNFSPVGNVMSIFNPKYNEFEVSPGNFAFGAATGLVGVGDSTTFSFLSTLPPTGVVGITGNTSIGGGGVSSLGPGPLVATVPEAGTFALAGLGLLPLGFLARRRTAKQC